MKHIIQFSLFLLVIVSTNIFSQASGVYIPRNMQKAFLNQTRSMDGKPGPNYWQNRSAYKMNIDFEPSTRLLKGYEKITYFNNSPDTLTEINVHLFPNIFKKSASRDFNIGTDNENDGITIEKIAHNGTPVDPSANNKMVVYDGTFLKIKLVTPILPGTSSEFTFDWSYYITKGMGVRTGTIDPSTFYIAYFYPHIAVYDDIDGWNDFQYTGGVEFYNDFSNFDVSITVPQNFVIRSTGVFQNPDEVLNEIFVKRYQQALTSDQVVNIIDSNDIAANKVTVQNKKNTWKFKADNVTDFAFGLSDHYLWDGSGLIVDKSTGRRVFIDAFYNKKAKDFYKVAATAREEINYLSTVLPGWPFPFPKETVFNGEGGMEYPMMVNDSSEPDSSMRELTVHEISHSYFPFFMGTNESKYAWMDEGWAAYLDYMTSSSLYGTKLILKHRIDIYKNSIGNDIDVPIFAISKYLKSPPYRYNAYIKAANFYNMLREYLAPDLFTKSLHEYMSRWNGKHPIPYDFFNTMSNASGEDLSWIIKPWFFEYGYLDLAIKDISLSGDKYNITIEKKGFYPAGFKVNLTYRDGTTEVISKNVGVWKTGNTTYTLEIPAGKQLIKAELWDTVWLDADSSNDVFILK
jgi:hypothetical protein